MLTSRSLEGSQSIVFKGNSEEVYQKELQFASFFVSRSVFHFLGHKSVKDGRFPFFFTNAFNELP